MKSIPPLRADAIDRFTHRRLIDQLDELLKGQSVYQDVLINGSTVRRGRRNCAERWNAIAPYLPATGALLDIGANFAWFSLRWCEEGPDRTAVAWEADLRSAAVARLVLSTHAHQRTVLLTSKATTERLQLFGRHGRRFAASLCLSTLHWLPDHENFLRALAAISNSVFVEHCDPRETGAGIESIRREIGEIGPYLQRLFPDRSVERLAEWNSHRTEEYRRELWLVRGDHDGSANATDCGRDATTSPALSAAALLSLEVSWPSRSWWRRQLPDLGRLPRNPPWVRRLFTPEGLQSQLCREDEADDAVALERAVEQIPESTVTTRRRRLRRIGDALRKRLALLMNRL